MVINTNDREFISGLLTETGAYQDLESPTILNSGELGIYYINAEKLSRDGGRYKDPEIKNNSEALLKHAMQMVGEHPSFKKVIEIITDEVDEIRMNENIPMEKFLISGGQTRDWFFSGPVAAMFKVPHMSIYKDGKIEIVYQDGAGSMVEQRPKMLGYTSVHVVDLLTGASSCFDPKTEPLSGWIPWQRRKDVDVRNLVAVVNRLQGGDALLKDVGVDTQSFVYIDEAFINKHSNNPERGLAYKRDPAGWSEDYLRQHGALEFVGDFNPEGDRVSKAANFLIKYDKVLRETGARSLLEVAVQEKYGKPMDEIVGGV